MNQAEYDQIEAETLHRFAARPSRLGLPDGKIRVAPGVVPTRREAEEEIERRRTFGVVRNSL